MADGQETDEKVESPYPRVKSMDSRFLSGCMTIAVLSIVFYGMLAWPFFAFPVHLRAGMIQVGLYGALPAFLLGALVLRRIGLEGATSFAGGSFAGAVFAYLRLDSLQLGKLADVRNLPPPDYPGHWAWMLPVAWCLVVTATILIVLPRRETQDEGGPKTNR